MALSRIVSEILNVVKYRDLEFPVKGQSRSVKVVPFDRLGTVSYSNVVPETHRFCDIRPKTRVRGHSGSSEPTRIDPATMTSY